ncbi:MAG: GNAT family N-acetyltransferase [Coxiellaceae bacterium]|nr:GNAT family N-acetyltransferase [Coxiellaceae bacterium]
MVDSRQKLKYAIYMHDIYTLKQIETPRLIIRPIQLGDEDQLHQALINTLEQLQRWMPWSQQCSKQATEAFVKQGVALWQSGKADCFHMVVIDKACDKIISASGYNNYSIPAVPLYDIGYWVDSNYQGKGYASEFTNALSRYAFDALQAQRLQINTQVENEKSIAVAKRCGFRHELVMKNECIDCVTNELADTVLLACCDIADLPPLDVSWQHGEHLVKPDAKQPAINVSDNPITLPILETERLTLKPPRPQDAAIAHQALMASIDQVAPWFSWAKPTLTVEQFAQHLTEGATAATDIKQHNHLFYLVWDKTNHTFIGEVWLKIIDWSVMSANVAYWFDTRHSGNGYATEAIKQLIQYAIDSLGAHRLQVDISEENHRSLAVAKRLNLSFEGSVKNRYRNFITNEKSDGQYFSSINR